MMSIAVLHDVYQEVRRLAIAGSSVSSGDFRLKKLIPQLRKLGEKAPVFTRLADGAERVVTSNEKSSAGALLDLAGLIISILYTQGNSNIEGKLEELPLSPLKALKTQTSARVLKPLIEALTTTGSGRLEQIKLAYDMNLFNDLRVVRPALRALDDSYSEIGEFIADNVLPIYGAAIYDELRATYDMKGKAGHGRRLKLMHRIDPDRTRDLITRALEEGSKEVKLMAIECLGDSEEDLQYLLDQAKALAKDVRAAALLSLARANSSLAEDFLKRVLESKDVDLLIRPAKEIRPPRLLEAALQLAKTEFDTLLASKEPKTQKVSVGRLLHLIRIASAGKKNAKVEKFLSSIISHSSKLQGIKSDPSGMDVVELAVRELSGSSKAARQFLVENRESIPAEFWGDILEAGKTLLSPKDFFNTFSPYLNTSARKSSVEYKRSESIQAHIGSDRVRILRTRSGSSSEDDHPSSKAVSLDPAWLGLAIQLELDELVLAMAKLPHPRLHDYLTKLWSKPKTKGGKSDLTDIAMAMLESQHPEAQKLILQQISKLRTSQQLNYQVFSWGWVCRNLPALAIPELEAFVADPKTPDLLSGVLLEAIQCIRERAQSSSA